MIDLGTVRPGSTIRIPFSSFDKDDGSSITMTNYAVGDILVYKDGSTTERASTSGYTATTDFDAKTGKHLAIIDLADNTTAGFFAAGSEYLVAIDAVTVDTVTTGGWIARFRIGYRGAVLDTTIATLASQTSFTLASGPAEDDALNGMWAVIHDVASAVQMSWVQILDYTGSTKTVTLAAGATFTAATTDNISVMMPAPLQPATTGRTALLDSSGTVTLTDGSLTAAKIADGAIDRATFAADTGLQTVRSNTAQSGSTSTSIKLDASASSTTDIYKGNRVLITGGTGAGQERTITAYNGGSKQATVSRAWITTPDNTSTFAIKGDDAPSINANLQVTANVSQAVIRSGTAQSGSTSNTIKLDTGASATNNVYVGNVITIVSGAGLGQTRTIVSYNGTTKVATVDRDWNTTPTNTSVFNILANTTPTTFSDQGVAQAGTTSTITLASTASATDSIYVGSLVTILSGTGSGDTSEITAYNGTTKVATVSPNFSVAPDSTSAYAVIPTNSGTGALPGAQDVNVVSWAGASVAVVSGNPKVSLAADGMDAIVIETGMNARQAISIATAAAAGVLSGAATTNVIVKGAGVGTTRIDATVTSDGDRTQVTLSLPA